MSSLAKHKMTQELQLMQDQMQRQWVETKTTTACDMSLQRRYTCTLTILALTVIISAKWLTSTLCPLGRLLYSNSYLRVLASFTCSKAFYDFRTVFEVHLTLQTPISKPACPIVTFTISSCWHKALSRRWLVWVAPFIAHSANFMLPHPAVRSVDVLCC